MSRNTCEVVDNAEQTCFMTEDEVKSSVVSQSRVGQRKLKLVTERRNLDCHRKTYDFKIICTTLDIWERLLNCRRGEMH